ncbi:beta-glucosidase [Reichenbachiella agariperforans]|uniref:beta-N-acetylhexosaminidase n=1 Tax=Reichenbachiella agariperforans TaxID=156994 RepID=A0A1M6Q4P8_REIAG|nr:glycoside hydrolase family 3 N-terminal domain-containing protein [Reichenbachiella agariperforans]SHK15131.1 beta-glucosidase [Reichenbachiella agariperforans]
MKNDIKVGQEDSQAQSWASQMLSGFSVEQKIGQLIHVATWSNKNDEHTTYIKDLIQKYGVGGLIFFQGDPVSQARLTNEYQSSSETPLMISIDGEWGLGMRLDNAEPFPYQMTLGAIEDEKAIEEMGGIVARQMKRIGIHVNHAPVIDVNTNPDNPVINFRSFGQDKIKVAQKGTAYMKGMQSEGILAVAKHFPGHGDTASDSHKELPKLDKSRAELEETELYPFKKLFAAGLGAVMVAHLQIPQLEPDTKRASTLSRSIVQDLLKGDMGFEGLVFTDALDMKAVADHYAIGEVDVEAFKAGNDVLLFVQDVEATIQQFKVALADGSITEEQLDERCLKQLVAKYNMGLDQIEPIKLEGILEDINRDTRTINEQLYEASMTQVKHTEGLLNDESIGMLSLFANGDQAEQGALSHHTLLKGTLDQTGTPLFEQLVTKDLGIEKSISLRFDQIESKKEKVISELKEKQAVIVAIHNVKLKAPDNFGITAEMAQLVADLSNAVPVYLVFFGNAYAVSKLGSLNHVKSMLLAYQENEYTHRLAYEIVSNKKEAKGILPVSI